MKEHNETSVSPLRVALFLFAIAVLLLIAHLVAEAVESVAGEHLPERATSIWYLHEENNIPTWFASILLALVGGALLLVGILKYQERDRHYRQWLALALIPLALSLDEMAQIHEGFSEPLSDAYGFGGLLHYAWIVAAAPIVLLLTLLFIPFLRRLPGRTFLLLLAGAGMTFTGGMGVEMAEGWWVDAHGEGGAISLSIALVQEMMEMFGSIIALYAVMDYLAGYRPELVVRLERDRLPVAKEPERPLAGEAGFGWSPAERS